jgi:hypothetical protein
VDFSLNHDEIASFSIPQMTKIPKSVANLAGGTVWVHPYASEMACQYLKPFVYV